MIFDSNDVFQQFGYQQITTSANNDHEQLALTNFNVPVNGTMYVYVANESSENVDVWFDDITIIHKKNTWGLQVTNSADYYPFGGQIKALSYQKPSSVVNAYGYQGLYAELDENTGWHGFELRQYDAFLGRWMSMDPYGQYASPYVGMGNSPVNGVDPNGGLFGLGVFGSTLVGAGIGAAVGAGIGLIADEDNWGYYAATGALIGGAIGYIDGYKSVPGDPRRPPIGGQGGPPSNEVPTIDSPGSKIGRLEPIGGRKETLSIPEERKIPNVKTETAKTNNSRGQTKTLKTPPLNPKRSTIPTIVQIERASTAVSQAFVFGTAFTGIKRVANWAENEIMSQRKINNSLLKSPLTKVEPLKVPKGVRFFGKFGGLGFTAWSAYDVEQQFRSGEINSFQRWAEQILNGIGAVPLIGTGWSIGWEMGRGITNIPSYQEWKKNTWLRWRKDVLGY